MKTFISLSQYPGTFGETNYSKFFKLKGLPYTYTAKKCEDIVGCIAEVKNSNIDGFSISMPFKKTIIDYLDEVFPLVVKFKSCNTVTIIKNKMIGYNTDYYGAIGVIEGISETEGISILGDGAMGSMFKKLLGSRATVFSRTNGNWADRHKIVNTVINCTSFGTSVPDSPFKLLPNVSCVIDLAISSTSNQLKKQCEVNNIKYVAGVEFYRHQFKYQFELFTGIKLTQEEINSI